MNKELLYKHLDNYLSRVNLDNDFNDLKERLEREEYYKSYTSDKIVSMDEDEFYEYISKLWAMIIWGNKHYIIDKYINDNGFENLKKSIAYLLYGNDSIEIRWDTFKEKIKGFGPAMMSELLCYINPNEYMIWNTTALNAYKYLGIKDVPRHNYQLTGKKYMELTQYSKEIQQVISEKYNKKENLLFVDYFFWDSLRELEPINEEKNQPKETVVNNKSYHNEIIDYIKNIGSLLGYNTDVKGNIKNSGKIADAIWEFNVGNLGKIKYVFEVQDNGSIDSLIVSLMNASQDISVQAVVAVSDEHQINKIKQHCNNIEGSFNGKLKFWNITEVERAYTELSSSMEIINKAINVEIDK